ncbi:MAG: T9SS type A sorting domain-containing protein [Bacteroidetes bacterium]|nr:T9SS type A sorting domain-containing protein [Bacteroidota bacterium]
MKLSFTRFLLFILIAPCSTFSQNFTGKLGYGFSPKGFPYDYSQMAAFLQEVANTCNGGVILANGSWRDSYAASGQIPGFQEAICGLQPSPYTYIDMSVFGWGTPTIPYTLYLNVPGDSTNNWTNATAKSLFLQMLINAADSLQPTYFFIGNEISFYWVQDSVDYMNWVDFYHTAYDSIKVHSPSSKVGTVFNYEHFLGNGSFIGWNTPYWNALNAFDTSKIDILGLTVYPFFGISEADSVPDTYLDPIFSRWGNKPIAITETGWPADSFFSPWVSSPQQQVNFVNKIFTIINGQNVEVVNWLFLNYLMDWSTDENKIGCSISMRDSLGNDRPALPVWLSYCNTTGNRIFDTRGLMSDIYPNPSDGEFTVSGITGPAGISVYNIMGERIFHNNNSVNEEKIKLMNEDHGIYFLRLETDRLVFMKKIIIQK